MLTGAEYRDSLNDGRAVYFEGRRLANVEADPRFLMAIDHVAASYDRYHRPEPGATNPIMAPPRSREEMRERVDEWLDMDVVSDTTYQSLSMFSTVAAQIKDTAPDRAARINAFIDDALTRDVRIVECITDAKGNRSARPSAQEDPDAYVRVVDRTDDGVVIRGAKLHITGAAFAHELAVMPTKGMRPGEEEYAIACVVPVNAPGVKIVNVGFVQDSDDLRDYPYSSRVAMFDAFVIFDDVFVPYERVFLDGQTPEAAMFAHALGLWERLGGVTMMVEAYDELVGFAVLIAEANGLGRVAHVREKIDEMAIQATLLRAGLEAAIANAHETAEGSFYPDELFTNAAKYHAAANYNLMVRHLHDIAGGSVTTVPGIADLENSEVGEHLRKYMSTGSAVDGEYRTRLFHAIRDLTAESYGGWRQVTFLQSGGGLFAQRIVTRGRYDFERAKRLALDAAGLTTADQTAAGPALVG